jgi:WD40 repeat protein
LRTIPTYVILALHNLKMVFHPGSADSTQPSYVSRKVLALLGMLAGAMVLSACIGLIPQAATLPMPKQRGGEENATLPAGRSESAADVVASGTEALVFASDRAGNGDIFVAQPGRPLVNLTAHPAGDWDPVWSPACADPAATCRIAFTSHRSGDSEIWVMDNYGRNLINVTQHPAWDYWPDWSPDGQAIVFVSERDGDQELFTQPVQGGKATQLTFNDESDRLPAWSPDGTRIAFAAVRNDVEAIHLISIDGSHEWSLTHWPLRATSPAWSPDGRQIAFVGWDQRDRPGIYIMEIDAHVPRLVWEGTAWIGSLAWSRGSSADARDGWLLFTSWRDGNHELYALSPDGGEPVRVTRNPAWDDFPDLRAGLAVRPDAWLADAPMPTTAVASVGETAGPGEFAYGANVADLGKAYLVRDLGFGWAKGYVNWETVEQKRGKYRWDDPDNTVSAFQSQGLRILLRVHGTPGWAKPADAFLSYPPNDMADFAHFMGILAGRYRGQVAAYEIWNEPNLNYEWGYLPPDPARYTEMLKAAYRAVKTVDPAALIISGGLATTGDGSPTAMGDLDYLQGMYDAGARGYFDALGSHPYAFGHDPDYQDAWGLCLSRVVAQRQVMIANGDEATPIWITELGWVLRTSWNLVEHEAFGVNELQQARYLVRAYQKTRTEWPWVHAVFLFNLDFSSVPWYTAAEPMRWYAILNPDRTPRPAYTDLKYQLANDK